jgi:predicted PurR-regulated permease PerM
VVSTIFGLIVAAIDTTFLWIAGVPLVLLWGLLAFGAVLAIPLTLLAKALLLDVDPDSPQRTVTTG